MRNAAFLQRRPHRSFRRTRRRDYVRSLKLPGYWLFTIQVWRYLWRNRRLFGLLALIYALLTVLLGGITNQQVYQQINDLINQSAGEVIKGAFGSAGQAATLLVATFMSPGEISSEQQIYLSIIALMVWMTTVWLLRELMAGRLPKLRDGIYSAGSPIIATLLVALVAVIQLIPVGLVALAYAGLSSVGILQEGLGMMLFWVFAGLVITLVLYWMTSTFLALVIVTLPGMYPLRAIKAAGDLIVGRRLRVMYRMLWMVFIVALAWAVFMIPMVLLDTGLKNIWPAIKDVPFIPILVALSSSATLVWISAYIYMLYRKIVNDDASPA